MNCPICNSFSIEKFHDYGNFILLICKKCGLIFQDQTNKIEVNNLITEIYDENWVKMRDQATKDTFISHSTFNNLFLEMYSPNKGDLLEIGSGTGEFLFLAQEAGWNAIGIEPSAIACSYAKKRYNLNIINSLWNKDLFKPDQKFDAIVFWHVLEHIGDPVSFLKEIKYNLKSSGTIYFSIPNNNSLANTLLGYRSPIYQEKDHLFHFSKENILNLLNLVSLEPITIFSRETTEQLIKDVRLGIELSKVQEILDIKDWMSIQTRLQSNFEGYELFCATRAI